MEAAALSLLHAVKSSKWLKASLAMGESESHLSTSKVSSTFLSFGVGVVPMVLHSSVVVAGF